METINYTPPLTIKQFIKDYRPGELFYDWIVGPVGCLPADSEFLTPSGWKRMDAWTAGDKVAVYAADTGAVTYEEAEYVRLPALEPFIRFDSGSLEMELSPEHRVLYTDYRGVRQVATAAECALRPSRRTIPTTFALATSDASLSDAEIRLRVAFSADGHIPKTGRKVKVTIRKERKKARLRTLLTDMALAWTEKCYASRPTETIFSFAWPDAIKSLAFVWSLSSRQLGVVLDECTRWDGLNEHAERRYYTTVRAHADAIQYAAHACGFRAAIHQTDDPRNESWATHYTVAIRASDNLENRAAIRAETRITRLPAVDGFKYCFTTSTGFFVARCNGKIFVTGNSGKTTALFFKLCHMAAKQERGPDGIRRTRAVVVRNTMPQLRDTTLTSWSYWFKDGVAGKWHASTNTFDLKFGDVECEVLFRPLDTSADIARVLSLEVSFAIIDEFVQIPKEIIDALSARLGRYPGSTNWGMWGSSNPDTEDSWWFDYLHNSSNVKRFNAYVSNEPLRSGSTLPAQVNVEDVNASYFVQPSGFSDEAENLENLPGGRGYYTNQAKGKSPAWIKQFIEAEWGFSAAGTPVVSSFRPDLHIARDRLRLNPARPLIVGLDPGIRGSALIFGQEDLDGRLLVLGELVQSGYGVERLIKDRMKPYIRNRWPQMNLEQVWIAPDPAAANRAQTDEKTAVQIMAKHFRVINESNNRFPLRLNAMEHFTTTLTGVGPALQIDPYECPTLIRALKGGWRYEKATKHDGLKSAQAEDNPYTHPGDAFGYLCRFFHRQTLREMRYTGVATGQHRQFTPPRSFGGGYHAR